MIDATKVLDAFREFLTELTMQVEATAAQVVAVAGQVDTIANDKPGDTQTGEGEGTIGPITRISAAGPDLWHVEGQGFRMGMNVAVIDDAGKSCGYPLLVKPGSAQFQALLTPGSYQGRITNPVTYATSPWFSFTV
jgi:hypothetical protein